MAVEMFKAFSNAAERAELVSKICDKFQTPTGPRIRAFLAESGIGFTQNDIRVLLPAAKAETTKRLQFLAAELSKVIRTNPQKAEIESAASRLGFQISDQYVYERLREMLQAYPELWLEDPKRFPVKFTLGPIDSVLMERTSNMLGVGPSETVAFLLRAFAIAVDGRMVDPIDIVTLTRKMRDDDVHRASAIFELMNLREK